MRAAESKKFCKNCGAKWCAISINPRTGEPTYRCMPCWIMQVWLGRAMAEAFIRGC